MNWMDFIGDTHSIKKFIATLTVSPKMPGGVAQHSYPRGRLQDGKKVKEKFNVSLNC